jgi:type I restriction enzyme M protein
MSKAIDQAEINALAWKACDTFRGVVDPSQYKDYILVFLFLKYLSDVVRDRREELHKQYAGDKMRIERALARERFVLPEGSSYYDLYDKRDKDDIGDRISKALDAIEEANKAKLDGVFRNIDFNSEANLGKTKDRNRRLKNLIEDFADERLDFRPSRIGNLDIIGNTYQYLIAQFASDSGKKGGEFFTPAEVSELLARLMAPQPGMRIYDPTCGSGSLLIKVAEKVPSHDYSLYGQESNGGNWALCRMNMLIHANDNACIEWGDTINNPLLVEGDKLMKFDVAVSNPPFSLDKWGQENAAHDRYNRFWRGTPPKSKGDYAFITHLLESLNEHGRAGVIVPHGVLFRGSSERLLRKAFIDENLLEAVIGLPAQLFFGTGIPAAILVFNKVRSTTDVLFIDASSHYQDGKKQNRLREEDLARVVDTYTAFRAAPATITDEQRVLAEKYAYRASLAEIQENDYNLNIPRYVDTFEEEAPVDIAAVQQQITGLEAQLAEVRKEMDGYLKDLGFITK